MDRHSVIRIPICHWDKAPWTNLEYSLSHSAGRKICQLFHGAASQWQMLMRMTADADAKRQMLM